MDPKTAQSAPLPGGVNSQNTSNTVPDSKQTPFLESSEGQSTPSAQGLSQGATPQTNPQITQIAPETILQSTKGSVGKKGGSGFKIFVIIALLIIAGIYSVVGYLYFNNQKLKAGSSSNETTETPSVSPTPAFSADQIKIKNGSVVREIPGGDATTLVAKGDYESTGITGFARVVVSPDNQKICFESWPPAPEPAMYIANIDGSEIVEVNPNRQSCLWKSDTKCVFYINTTSTTSPVNIFYFDLASQEETNVTAESVTEGTVRRYKIVGLSGDGGKVICTYENLGSDSPSAEGECEINVNTLQVTLL